VQERTGTTEEAVMARSRLTHLVRLVIATGAAALLTLATSAMVFAGGEAGPFPK
jgi:hypothetical protein